jgi:phospho-N-acetylmuramoyl-pentapeptide-transferase
LRPLEEVVYPFWVSFVVAAVLAMPVLHMLLRLRSRQTIDVYAPESHQLKQGTPTMGGLMIVAGVLAAGLAAGLAAAPGVSVPPVLAPGLFVFAGFASIGFLDDFVVPRVFGKRGLGWKQKIVLEIAVAGVAAAWLYGWSLGGPFAVALFLILFVSNAYNFADGLDGLAGSLLLGLAAGLLALIALASPDQWGAMILLAALLGGVVPFLFLNAPPAKVFMGDVGSLAIGAALGLIVAALFVPANPGAYVRWDLFGPLLVIGFMMVAELVPVPMQVFWYKLTKRRLFPMTPIHHGFEKIGWPESRVVWRFGLAQLLLSAAGVSLWLIASR